MLAVALSLLSEGGEAAEKVANPVLPTVPEMVWGAIAFFSLLALMKFVLLPPIKQSTRKREERIRADEEAAERAIVESEQIRRDYDATLAEARAEAARIIDEARESAEAKRSEIIRAAEDEVANARQGALAELETERGSALDSLRTQVATIAVSAAGKVIQKPLDVAANQAVVDAHVSRADA
ncbi:MAG: F0F1 ATP synthase subunit B [Microthrixaceae bacterium]|nr:F0F1 ATP synthase subunit B [Microthrixaceae bacterium]MCO5313457.1 F0F1 ATP synthase subunit B [Microthrixaceae bacterium]HPB45096.1 F0F1 ATP synthase subunit B [Microthrixaceae bacterium]